MSGCPGSGKAPVEMVCQPEPGVRDLRYGRGICPVCKRTLALTKSGGMKGHK